MKLKSFRIIDCFGFSDSGACNFETPSKHSLFYIIGRNSSGKSSFLRGLNSLEYDIIPENQKGFRNHKGTTQDPRLEAIFSINKKDFKIEEFLNNVKEKLLKTKSGIPDQLLSGDERVLGFIATLRTSYGEFMRNLGEEIKVNKFGNGNYRFVDEGDTYINRILEIDSALELLFNTRAGDTKQFRDGNQPYNLNFTADDIENLLFLAFPRIYVFDKKYDLRSDIPDIIQISHLDNFGEQPEAFKTLIDYIGKDKVREYLSTNDSEKQEALDKEFKELIDTALRKVKHPLLDVISRNNRNGLQLTFKAHGVPSYFSLLSDNTKFLFHFLIYSEYYDIDNGVILFDEPDNGFHATAQQDLLDNIKDISIKNTVILSTHSEYLIDTDLLLNIRRMTRDGENDLAIENNIYFKNNVKGEYLSLQPIAESIGIKYVNQLKIQNNVIVVEGLSDLFYIRAFTKLVKKVDITNLLPGRGDSTMLVIVPFLISQGLNFKIVLDTNHKQGDKSKMLISDILQNDYNIDPDSIFIIPPLLRQKEDSGIEDIFSKEDFKKFVLEGEIDTSKGVKFERISNSAFIKAEKSYNKSTLAYNFFSKISEYAIADFDTITQKRITDLVDFVMAPNNFYKMG